MGAFVIRFLLLHPEIGSVKLPAKLAVICDEATLIKADNERFLAWVIPALREEI